MVGCVNSEWGLFDVVFVDIDEVEVATVVIDGLRSSAPPDWFAVGTGAVDVVPLVEAAETAEDSGPDMLFILDRNEVTRL